MLGDFTLTPISYGSASVQALQLVYRMFLKYKCNANAKNCRSKCSLVVFNCSATAKKVPVFSNMCCLTAVWNAVKRTVCDPRIYAKVRAIFAAVSTAKGISVVMQLTLQFQSTVYVHM